MNIKNNESKIICIYHGNCQDGFGAAWAVHHALGNEVEFYKGIHQQSPPDVTGLNVLLVDFSYKREVLLEMLKTAASITILDHHISAQKDLSDLMATGQIKGLFDMSKSGAMLAWEWFHPELAAPKLIEHIQDRDLWQFRLPSTKEITSALASYPYDFSVWDKLMSGNQQDFDRMRCDGDAIERRMQIDIQTLIASGVRRMNIGGYNVPVLNVPASYVSDAGHILSKDEPFAVCYWDHAHGRAFSLRSSEAGIDVSAVAMKYGGGGHVNAAGFTAMTGWEGE